MGLSACPSSVLRGSTRCFLFRCSFLVFFLSCSPAVAVREQDNSGVWMFRPEHFLTRSEHSSCFPLPSFYSLIKRKSGTRFNISLVPSFLTHLSCRFPASVARHRALRRPRTPLPLDLRPSSRCWPPAALFASSFPSLYPRSEGGERKPNAIFHVFLRRTIHHQVQRSLTHHGDDVADRLEGAVHVLLLRLLLLDLPALALGLFALLPFSADRRQHFLWFY